MIAPTLHPGGPDERAVLAWRFPTPVRALSSAPVRGGFTLLGWLVNIEVDSAHHRHDLAVHVAEVAARLGLPGSGAGLLTAAPVAQVCRAEDGGVLVDVTVGVTRPTWAAGPDNSWSSPVTSESGVRRPETINTVVQLPVALSPAAAVNAVVTATEAKCQALLEAGVPGTGTASDAIVVLWPAAGEPEDFCGPRSTWGARLARAVLAATADGLDHQ